MTRSGTAEKHQNGDTLVVRTPEAARRLAMSEDDLRALLHAGEIDHYTTRGGHFRVPVVALEAYVARRCAEEREARP